MIVFKKIQTEIFIIIPFYSPGIAPSVHYGVVYDSFKTIKWFAEMSISNYFDIVMNDLHQTDDLRVVDYNGHRILSNFKLKELGEPIYQELWE